MQAGVQCLNLLLEFRQVDARLNQKQPVMVEIDTCKAIFTNSVFKTTDIRLTITGS